jgi:hypothetical protein
MLQPLKISWQVSSAVDAEAMDPSTSKSSVVSQHAAIA